MSHLERDRSRFQTTIHRLLLFEVRLMLLVLEVAQCHVTSFNSVCVRDSYRAGRINLNQLWRPIYFMGGGVEELSEANQGFENNIYFLS